MLPGGNDRTALVLDPDRARGERLTQLVSDCAFDVKLATSSDEAWPLFARLRPQFVLAGLANGDGTAETFLRKLQTQFMGTMPRVFFVGHATQMKGIVLRPEGLLVPALTHDVITRVLRPDLEIGDTAARQVTRLRELYELTALSNDLASALDVLVSRTSLTFRTENCLLWGPGDEPFWPRTALAITGEERDRVIDSCRLALTAGIPMIQPGASVQTFLAAPLSAGTERGGICLVADGCRMFSVEELDALRAFGRRLAHELTFVTAHLKLLATHNRLRESAMVDPLLSIWTRAAFERAVVRQISSSRRRNETLHLAVFDFVRLRAINDRYGHLAGDGVLAHFARTVRDSLRAQDQVGRFGGDELAVLLVGSDDSGAETAIQKLLDRLQASPMVIDSLRIPMDVTVGLTRILADEVSGERAFSRAMSARSRARRAQKRLEISLPKESAGPQTSETSLVFDASAYAGMPTGSTIGGMYRVLHEISRGAMGVVYRGEDLGLGRPVAIKVLRSDLASDRSLVTRFREEAAVLASLHHRNLVQVYAFGEDGDDVFFVMELVEGQPLSDVIDHLEETSSSISSEAAIKIVDEIAEALEAIHAEGMIHRDVKPANILLDRINDRAVLVDVGVAKRAHEVGDAAGTPGFAAPESFTETPETSATDVYGLATTTYAMLTGTPPFGGGEILAVVNRQLFDPIPPPSSQRGDLPEQVDAVMLKALDPDPANRYQSATAFSISLSRALVRRSTESARIAAISASLPHFEMPEVSLPAPDGEPDAGASHEGFEAAEPAENAQHELPIPSELLSRGAFFGVARKLLIHQLGSPVLEALTASSEELAEMLAPDLRQSGWYPTENLARVLTFAGPRALGGARALAAKLGRSVMSATLAHLFGADPTSVTPSALLAATTSFWSRYHNWGSIELASSTPDSAVLHLTDPAPNVVICELVGGMLGRIPELAGVTSAESVHTECVTRGSKRCVFDLSWAPLGSDSKSP